MWARGTRRALATASKAQYHRHGRTAHNVPFVAAAVGCTSLYILSKSDNRENTILTISKIQSEQMAPPKIMATSASKSPSNPSSPYPNPPGSLRRFLASPYAPGLNILFPLPIPRILTSADLQKVFSWPELRRGLKQRRKDEECLRNLQPEVQRAVADARAAANGEEEEEAKRRIAVLVDEVSEVAYGKGVSPQLRQDFLEQYGCAPYNEQVLELLYTLGMENIDEESDGLTERERIPRGIVEIGAGNGQWSRALDDYYNSKQQQQQTHPAKTQEFIVAYDDMSSLPLDPNIYHRRTLPAAKYFFPKLRKGSHTRVFTPATHGRVLLLVFPPPGPMAREALRAYLRASPENDTIVYVGEGLGGANADEAFFRLFCRDDEEWVLMHCMELPVLEINPKGLEKLFVLKRVPGPSGNEMKHEKRKEVR